MGRASKYRAPSEYEHWNPEHERARACARILGPSIERVRASFRASVIKGMQIFSPRICKKKLIFLLSFFYFIFFMLYFVWWQFFLSIDIEVNFFFIFDTAIFKFIIENFILWCSPSTLRASTPSTSEHEHVLRLQNPSTIKKTEHRVSTERASSEHVLGPISNIMPRSSNDIYLFQIKQMSYFQNLFKRC